MQEKEPYKVAKIAAYGVIIDAFMLSAYWISAFLYGVSINLTALFLFTIITLLYFAWLVLVSIQRA
jgi:hypothetical protein